MDASRVDGGRPEGFEAGFYVKPTVFVNVKNDMTIAQEEIFGPLAKRVSLKNRETTGAYFLQFLNLGRNGRSENRRRAGPLLKGRVSVWPYRNGATGRSWNR